MAYTPRFSDTFTEAADTNLASHAPNAGLSWGAQIGAGSGPRTVIASDDTLCHPFSGGGLSLSASQANIVGDWSADQQAEATGWLNVGDTVGIGTRILDDGAGEPDGYRAGYGFGGVNSWHIQRIDSNVSTALGAFADASPADANVIILQSEGTTHKLFEDGVERVSVTDATYPAGKPGFISQRSLPSGGLDDFVARDQPPIAGSASGPGLAIGSSNSFVGEGAIGAPSTPEFVEWDVYSKAAPWFKGPPGLHRQFARSTESFVPGVSVQTIAVGQAIETDTAQAITWAPKRRLVAQVTETDISNAIGQIKTRTLAQATETDIANAVTARKTRAVAQATETDIANAIAHAKIKALVAVLETDIANAVTPRKTVAIGQALEVDTSQTITRLITGVAVNQVVETDISQAVAWRKIRFVGQALETDTANGIAWAPKRRLVNQVVETDISQAIGRLKIKLLGQVLETDLAQAIAHTKTRSVGQTVETDTAQAIARLKARTVGQAAEADLAQAINKVKIRQLAQALETDLANAVVRVNVINMAFEVDLAQALTIVGGVPPAIHKTKGAGSFLISETLRGSL